MREIKYWQAINEALTEELERDERVVVFGQDVAQPGGSFGGTRRLLERFGRDRIMDTPISEQAAMGAAVGMAAVGIRPVVEILFMDFLAIASDQVINQVAKLEYFSGGRLRAPIVIKTGVGTEMGMGAQHSHSLEAWYAGVPGLKVVWGGTPADAKGLLKSAIRDNGPVLFMESLALLSERGPVGDETALRTIGRASVVRSGIDATVVTWGTMRPRAERAAAMLAERGLEVELIDLLTLAPWDQECVLESVRKTHRCAVVSEAPRAFGPAAEIASQVAELAFDDLDAPVIRITSRAVPAPQRRSLDRLRVPQAEDIAREVGALAGVHQTVVEEQ